MLLFFSVSEAKPIAAPACICPLPLIAIGTILRHQHSYVSHCDIRTAHIYIHAVGFPPAADGKLIPTPITAVTH